MRKESVSHVSVFYSNLQPRLLSFLILPDPCLLVQLESKGEWTTHVAWVVVFFAEQMIWNLRAWLWHCFHLSKYNCTLLSSQCWRWIFNEEVLYVRVVILERKTVNPLCCTRGVKAAMAHDTVLENAGMEWICQAYISVNTLNLRIGLESCKSSSPSLIHELGVFRNLLRALRKTKLKVSGLLENALP